MKTTHRHTLTLAALATALILSAAPLRADMGDILHSIPCAGDNTADLAWVNGELYQVIFSPTEQRNIYRLDPETGDVLGIVPYAGSMPQGLTFDGTNLWQVCLTAKCIFKMDPITGEVHDFFDAPGGGDGQPIGLGWDGEWLYLGDSRDPEKIWQLDTLGVVQGQYPTPGDSPYGLAWADGFVWVSENNMGGTATIFKMDAQTGEILDSFPCPGGGGSPNGITHDGQYLWIAVNTNDMIYQVDDGVAGAGVEPGVLGGPAPLRLLSARMEPNRRGVDVRFVLSRTADVRAQLFDIRGRQTVQTLLSAPSAGHHALRLARQDLPAGVYYVRLACDGHADQRKVVVIH